VASIVAAVAYLVLPRSIIPELWLILLRGAACALLALYALFQSGRDGRLLVAIMAIAALGDLAIAIDLGLGGILFFIYLVVAISLYLRHPREHATSSQKKAAVLLLFLTPVVAWLLPTDRAAAWSVGLYGLALGGMAACAWMSAFPRYRVGIGAVLFLASDLLLIAGMGPLAGKWLASELVWPLYYAGQFLITVGVVETLRKRHDDVITDV
jgi:uncharacterized membrane protein YhhN